MKRTNQTKKLLVVSGILLSLTAAVWLVGAIESGLFIVEDDRPASAPDEKSMELTKYSRKGEQQCRIRSIVANSCI